MMNATIATANADRADKSLDDMLDEILQHACGERSVEDNAALRRWLGTLFDSDAASAMTAVTQLPSLLERLSVDAVGRWLLTGVRLYPNEPARRQRYFQMLDTRAVETIEREASAPGLPASIPSLTLLLEALSERRVRIQAQRFDTLAAAPQRPILTSTHLLLPADYTALDADDPGRLFRASVAHAVAHLRHSPAALPVKTLKPMSLAVISAVEDARVERLLIRDFPGIRMWFMPLLENSLQADGLSFPALISRMNYAVMEPSYSDDNYWVNKARALFEARAAALDDYAAFREIASILANDLGQMRVRFHPQQYVVPAPYRDDNTFLWTYPDAEPPEQSHDLHTESSVAAAPQQRNARDTEEKRWEEPETQRVQYPEWDYRLGLLRAPWCTVFERTSQRHSDSGTLPRRSSLAKLKLPAHASLTRSARLRRQAEGEELDLDAAIEHTIDRRRGHSPEHRVFIRPGTKQQPMSLLLLFDLSASSGEPVGASGLSILDIEKDAALMLAHAAIDAGHRIAVHGFASNTRECVNYYRLLDFGAPLDEARETAIRAAEPRYSTRMGAAIRHATTLVSSETADRRAIVVITDGAPSDIDVYDAQYLVHDAQAAATDARRAGIMTGGIAVDAGSADYMRRIVGREHCRTVSDPHALSTQLAALYVRLAQ
jgi:hypothetical protein